MNETTMDTMFKGYTDYTEKEFKRIWKDSIIVVDTNILLNLYRYSEDARKELLRVLTELKERLWIPYQVGKEYFNDKNIVITESYNDYSKLECELNKIIANAKSEVMQRRDSQLKCKEEVLDLLEKANNDVVKLLKTEKENKKPQITKNDIEKQIINLFNDCIGQPLNEEEYKVVKEEGLRRFEKGVPPGYKDKNKAENGDYYIFYSIIKQAKEINKDVIFVTDDVKEDWFNKVNGEKHGGRYELLNEFYAETGKLMLIYTSAGFMEAYFNNTSKSKGSNKNEEKKVINELKEVSSDVMISKEKINDVVLPMLKYFDKIEEIENNRNLPTDTVNELSLKARNELYKKIKKNNERDEKQEENIKKMYINILTGLRETETLVAWRYTLESLMEVLNLHKNYLFKAGPYIDLMFQISDLMIKIRYFDTNSKNLHFHKSIIEKGIVTIIDMMQEIQKL